MPSSAELARFIMAFINTLRDSHLAWKRERLDDILGLQHQKTLAKMELEAELEKRKAILKNEIERIISEGEAELKMLKDKHDREIKDYKQFLDAIDEMKEKIIETYQSIPLPMALTIHRHAKGLLNSLWDTDDLEEKILHERKLLRFLETIYEDTLALPADSPHSTRALPAKTIAFIHQQGRS